MKKQFLALCLCFSILLCGLTLACPVQAAGTLAGAGQAINASAGKTAEMELSITANPGISYIAITIKTDPEITLTSVKNGSILKDMDKGVNVIWSADSDSTGTGMLAKLTFTVASDAPAKTYPVQFIVRECYNADMEDVASSISSGSITVTCPHNNKTNVSAVAATCKEPGYTAGVFCEDCDTYISGHSVIAKTNEHDYAACEKIDSSTHKFTCTVCAKVITENHTWNKGSVTKPATCKEEGVKTYTCSGCKATKTEAVAKTTDHKYGSWTKVNDTTHKHTCSVCAKEETANHSWDGGKITKPATCKEEGVKTYTCSGCKTTKTEAIAKLTTHTYDHACDTDCNICGVTRTTAHNYKTSWSKDKTNHWYECSVCKDKKDAAAHTPGAKATETTAQTCTTCGYVIKAALGHKHNYATTWATDDAGHWYACSGCAEKGSYAAHDFENACDKDCAICGYTRETEHTFAEAWTTDANNHWHECTGCGLKQDEAAHEPGAEATTTAAQICTICSHELAPALDVPETEPTAAPDVTDPTVPAEPEPDGEAGFPIWIPIAIAVVVIGVAAAVIIKKKKA